MSDIGTGNATPYDLGLLGLLIALVCLSFIGAISHPVWSPFAATLVRRGSALLAGIAIAGVLLVTPRRDGMVGAGRLLTLGPAVTLVALGYILWGWRAKKL